MASLTTSSGTPPSNLTDGALNTPPGNTVTATNNSNITSAVFGYSGASSTIYLYGYAPSITSYAGHNEINVVNTASASTQYDQLNIGITGTAADIQVLGDTTYSITVDGTTTTITSQGTLNGFVWIPLFSGLSDGNHYVVIYATTQYGFIDSDATVRVTGASPALYTSPTDAVQLPLMAAPFSTYGALDGSPATGTLSTITNAYLWNPADGDIRFSAAATSISVYSYSYAGSVSLLLFQDGKQVGAASVPTSTSALTTLATGLDGLTHTYDINSAPTSDGNAWDAYSIVITGAGLNDIVQPSHYILGWYGDSIVLQDSSCGANTNTRLGDLYIVGRALNEGINRKGNSGQPVSTYLRDHTSQITGITPQPHIVVLEGGVNDISSGIPIGTVNTPGTFAGDMKTMISNTAAALPAGSTILVQGVLPSVIDSAYPTYEAAQQAAVTAYMSGSPSIPAYFMDTSNWINTSTDLCSDPHPGPAGFAKIANREIPVFAGLLSGSSYTATAPSPSSGTSGQASANFTVAIVPSSTFTGDQTITISDGGNGGTFTPSVGSAATSSVTATPTASTTSFTFTYTPASNGAKTISFTNGQDAWKNPASLSYTANALVVVPQQPIVTAPAAIGVSSGGTGFLPSISTTPPAATIPPPSSSFPSSSLTAGIPPAILANPAALIIYLQSEVSTLLNQLSCNTSPPLASRAAADAMDILPDDLSYRSSGQNVVVLQKFLIDQNTGPASHALGNVGPTGSFLSLTLAALKEFQASVCVPATGYFGPLTRAAITRRL